MHSILFCFIAIEVSVKPASSSRVTTKKVTLNLDGTIPAVGTVEDILSGGEKNVIKLMNIIYNKLIVLCTVYCVGV